MLRKRKIGNRVGEIARDENGRLQCITVASSLPGQAVRDPPESFGIKEAELETAPMSTSRNTSKENISDHFPSRDARKIKPKATLLTGTSGEWCEETSQGIRKVVIKPNYRLGTIPEHPTTPAAPRIPHQPTGVPASKSFNPKKRVKQAIEDGDSDTSEPIGDALEEGQCGDSPEGEGTWDEGDSEEEIPYPEVGSKRPRPMQPKSSEAVVRLVNLNLEVQCKDIVASEVLALQQHVSSSLASIQTRNSLFGSDAIRKLDIIWSVNSLHSILDGVDWREAPHDVFFKTLKGLMNGNIDNLSHQVTLNSLV